MRLYHASLSLLAAASISGCARQGMVLISATAMEQLPDETPWHRQSDLGHGIQTSFDFEKTKKGNGVLWFPGGVVQIYDAHNDGITFDPFALVTRLVDLDQDEYLDLEISGTGVQWDEKGVRELARRPVRATFRFNPNTKTFANAVADSWVFTQ